MCVPRNQFARADVQRRRADAQRRLNVLKRHIARRRILPRRQGNASGGDFFDRRIDVSLSGKTIDDLIQCLGNGFGRLSETRLIFRVPWRSNRFLCASSMRWREWSRTWIAVATISSWALRSSVVAARKEPLRTLRALAVSRAAIPVYNFPKLFPNTKIIRVEYILGYDVYQY